MIYVLDSPEQREELEHMLRGCHGINHMPVTLVVQPSNYGYGSACNAGAAEARAPVLLLLNSDVVPAGPGWLQPLLATLAAAPHLAAVGPKLLFANNSLQHAGLYFEQPDNGDWHNSHYFKGLPRYFPAALQAREVPGITGAAFCVRRPPIARSAASPPTTWSATTRIRTSACGCGRMAAASPMSRPPSCIISSGNPSTCTPAMPARWPRPTTAACTTAAGRRIWPG